MVALPCRCCITQCMPAAIPAQSMTCILALQQNVRAGARAGVVGAVVLPVTGIGVGVAQIVRGAAAQPEAWVQSAQGKVWDEVSRLHDDGLMFWDSASWLPACNQLCPLRPHGWGGELSLHGVRGRHDVLRAGCGRLQGGYASTSCTHF